MRYYNIITEVDRAKLFDEGQVRVIDIPDFQERLKRPLCELRNAQVTSLFGMPAVFKGTLHIDFPKLRSLKHAPKEVHGEFSVSSEQIMTDLTSLVGAPKRVDTDCSFSNTSITNLVGAPEHVGQNFRATGNRKLVSLQGMPKYVGGMITLSHCASMTSLKDIHKHVKHCENFLLFETPITSHIMGLILINGLKRIRSRIWEKHAWDSPEPEGLHEAFGIVSKYLGQGHDGLIDCQMELIEAGLQDYAQV